MTHFYLFMNTLLIRKRIRTAREGKDITQEEMAERLHIDLRTYTRIESGEKKGLDIVLLDQLAKELDMDISELLADDNSWSIDSISNTNGSVSGVFMEKVRIDNTDQQTRQLYETTIAELKALLTEKAEMIKILQDLLKQSGSKEL